MITILGAIIAGGASRRFGSDKAMAMLDGRALLDHVAAALARQVDEVVVVGRTWPGLTSVDDQPAPGLGPLGGLLGALDHGSAQGHALVLTVPCDCVGLPVDTVAMLGVAPCVLRDQPVIGLWPVTLATALRSHLAVIPQDRSMRRWIINCGAREVVASAVMPNINTPADLAAIKWRGDPRSSR